ncbi:unnamed protein product [Soboliphyme baturini]|uniref:ADF-H domain-containing protein n=1 Tax=Soboliphyme baturini TaxID=241478 RepID=A0A183IUR8_9BILA|nr:unnamed protein product [Soboliphyme baturini]
MCSTLKICHLTNGVAQHIDRFRRRKSHGTCALILKIDRTSHELVVEEDLEDCDLTTVCNHLPDRQPRFVILSYRSEHSDGRLSFPLLLVYCTPPGCSPEMQMMYAGSKNNVANAAGVDRVC